MKETNEILKQAQLIVRGNQINISENEDFIDTSGIYRFTNENITSYFHHLKNKKKVLTVIGSGNQVLNSILAGSKHIDCFDISVFPEYYLHLNIASIKALSKEEYLNYFLSDNREKLFSYELYEKIREHLNGKYKEFWDGLYDYNEGIDIYNSLLFRQDFYQEYNAVKMNPYLQGDNYYILKNILLNEKIEINCKVMDITNDKIDDKYDLINLSNILYYKYTNIKEYMEFLKNNFNLNANGEIINYFYKLSEDNIKEFINNDGNVEDMDEKKLITYKR